MLQNNLMGAWMRKIGILGFSFFMLKGLMWILVSWFVYIGLL